MKLVKKFTSAESQLWAALNANRAPARSDVYGAPELQGAKVLTKLGDDYDVGVVRPSAADRQPLLAGLRHDADRDHQRAASGEAAEAGDERRR